MTREEGGSLHCPGYSAGTVSGLQFEESVSMFRNPFRGRNTGPRVGDLKASLLGLVFLGVAACGNGPPRVILLNPLQGTFTTAATVQVDGVLLDVNLDAVADVRVNGISVMPLAPGGLFSATVPLDPTRAFDLPFRAREFDP